MIYRRHYIQFNDFVFGKTVDNDPSASFKNEVSEYSFTHGSYPRLKKPYMLAESSTASLTVTLEMKKLPCEQRPFYLDFVKAELSKVGKLWAVQGTQIAWAHAYITNLSESTESKKDEVELDIEFYLPEGVWHKANKQKTFLKPWSVCDFMDCYDFHDVSPCDPIGDACCKCAEVHPVGCNCCDCQGLSKEMALCYADDKEMQSLYSCDPEYRLVYSCEGAERYFDDVGVKICSDCGTITGNVYSDTIIPTNGVGIHISGEVTDPWIEINGNANRIKGTYEGLTIYPDGTATYGCGECYEVGVENWVVPEGNGYGWEFHQGNNRVIIETGNCCGVVCATFDIDALTV